MRTFTISPGNNSAAIWWICVHLQVVTAEAFSEPAARYRARVGPSACTFRSGDLAGGRLLLGNILENERTEGVTVEQHRKALPGEPMTSEGGYTASGVGAPRGGDEEESGSLIQ